MPSVVSLFSGGGYYQKEAVSMVNGKTIYLGTYDTIEATKSVRGKAEGKHFGEFIYKGGNNDI